MCTYSNCLMPLPSGTREKFASLPLRRLLNNPRKNDDLELETTKAFIAHWHKHSSRSPMAAITSSALQALYTSACTLLYIL